MPVKNFRLSKSVNAFLKRLFHKRNIIVISDHKIDHIPLSGQLQILLIIGLIGLFSGTSYITGSYITARASLKDKEAKLETVTAIEKSRIGQDVDVIKRDLMQLSVNDKELKQTTDSLNGASRAAQNLTPSIDNRMALMNQSHDALVERVSDLEARMQKAKDENVHLVTAIRERTNKKITYFEDIIAMTGLDSNDLERKAAEEAAGSKDAHASLSLAPTPVAQIPADIDHENTAKKDEKSHGENQGGPFIPYDSMAFNDKDRELLADVDRLVMLHDIVEQLPLRQPIEDAQQMSPFGRRIDPINGRWSMHPGVDLAGATSSHIFSTNAGRVIFAGRKVAYGNVIDIEHRFGIVTRYAHLSKILVKEGDVVKKGQQIGVQGSTGRSTGAHLHYEVRINDRPVNPVKFLHAGEYVLEK